LTSSFDGFRENLQKLVAKFETDKAHYVSKPGMTRMVALVERMLELNKKKHSGKLAPSEIDRLEREIAATDEEIDNLVYELYGITDEECKIIEGSL
jgi:hypothetical protein